MTKKRKYTKDLFVKLVEEFQQQEAKLLKIKRGEYTRASQGDTLANFRQVAAFEGRRPAETCLTYIFKHIQSLQQAVASDSYDFTWWGEEKGVEGIKQRIADARNFLLLLAAIMDDEQRYKSDMAMGATNSGTNMVLDAGQEVVMETMKEYEARTEARDRLEASESVETTPPGRGVESERGKLSRPHRNPGPISWSKSISTGMYRVSHESTILVTNVATEAEADAIYEMLDQFVWMWDPTAKGKWSWLRKPDGMSNQCEIWHAGRHLMDVTDRAVAKTLCDALNRLPWKVCGLRADVNS